MITSLGGEAEEPRVGESEEQYQVPDGADDAREILCREAAAQLLNPFFLFDERLGCGDAWGRHVQVRGEAAALGPGDAVAHHAVLAALAGPGGGPGHA
ncbi:hypothetical protein ACPCVL_03840 [Streptomyces koyangensis]|uniref:hypothetical protein n=1 Tax=Streptomyces koyangensis TaxID=188770 RepID=UPI003C2C08E6